MGLAGSLASPLSKRRRAAFRPHQQARLAAAPTMRFLLTILLLPLALQAQDERVATSPDGQLAIHIFATIPKDALWGRIGYQVWYHGKPLLATSWMGLDR